jgi:predicted dehydrogenase
MKPIRVGVIGAGRMGERHCRVYSTMRGAEFVGVFDVDHVRGHEVAERYDARYFDSPIDLLHEVDAVTIATPTPFHFDLAMEAFMSGVHALIEKPLALTVEQGRTLVETARKSNLTVQVGHVERFNPAYIELKNVADDLSVVAVLIRRQSPFDISNKDVNVINDLMIHDIDLLLNLVGQPVESVMASGRAVMNGATDHAVANFVFQNGPIATLIASRVTQSKVRRVDITAQNAYVEGDLLSKSVSIHRRLMHEYKGAKYRQESIVENIQIPVAEPLLLEQQHFVECVRENRQPSVSVEDGLRAVEYAAEISRMARQNTLAVDESLPATSTLEVH